MLPSDVKEPRAPRVTHSLLVVTGLVYGACAVTYNAWTVTITAHAMHALLGRNRFPVESDIVSMQIVFAVLAAAHLLLAWTTRRIAGLHKVLESHLTQKVVLAVLALAVPLTILEVASRPFAPRFSKESTLFVHDPELGWRMRPDVITQWGGVMITTNARGLRGPAVSYQRKHDTLRILYLGDSVTFGYRIADYADTFPARVGQILGLQTGLEIETINAGCGGYSPWQEYRFLIDQGIKYSPDIVVVGFVLNDVTEKFELVRYGGKEESFQLSNSYYSRWDHILSHSGLAYQVRNIAREVRAKRILGNDIQLGAIQREQLNVETLIRSPDLEHIQAAWELTLHSLGNIVAECQARHVRVAIVVFPFRMQLLDPRGTSAPQTRIIEWAKELGVPALDLLLPLASEVTSGQMRPDTLFIDANHLTPAGARLAGEEIAMFLLPFTNNVGTNYGASPDSLRLDIESKIRQDGGQ